MRNGKLTPRKIVFVITGLYVGGAEMMLYKLLSRIDKNRFYPTVVSLMSRGPLDARVEALGIKVMQLNIGRGKLSPGGLLKLIKIIRHEQPDLIQGWMYHGFMAAQVAAFFLEQKVPVLWNVRGTHTDLRKEQLLTGMIIKLSGLLSFLPVKIINNSLTSALSHEELMGFRPDKRVIIPNGFDLEKFQPSPEARSQFRKEIGLSEDDFVIGLIARYHPVKDHSNFLHAAATVVESFPKVTFVMAGEGVDMDNDAITAQINSLQLNNHVKLLGGRDDIAYIMAGLDVVASSSYGEGFPNVIGEAMSCALPCVVTEVGDSAWIVGETGRVVPPQSPDALARGLLEIAHMGHEYRANLGKRARQRIIDIFSLESIVHQYETLYDEVISTFNISGKQ